MRDLLSRVLEHHRYGGEFGVAGKRTVAEKYKSIYSDGGVPSTVIFLFCARNFAAPRDKS